MSITYQGVMDLQKGAEKLSKERLQEESEDFGGVDAL
jgi:hypothetical protein